MNETFAIYKRDTGQIARVVSCNFEQIIASCASDELFMFVGDGKVSDATHYLNEEGGLEAFPPRPSRHHHWNFTSMAWDEDVSEERVLTDRRNAYPPIGDQLDAIWKELENSLLKTADAAAMLARIRAVKEAHPKPNSPTVVK